MDKGNTHYFFLNTEKNCLLGEAIEKHHIFCDCRKWKFLATTWEGRYEIVDKSYDKVGSFNMQLCPFCNKRLKGILAKDATHVADRPRWRFPKGGDYNYSNR